MLNKTEKPAPTDEQIEILDHVENSDENLIINALAGTGKTTTLTMVEAVSPQRPILCLAFNTRVAKEMAQKLPESADVRTFNSLGSRCWYAHIGKASKVDTKKTSDHFKEIVNGMRNATDRSIAWDHYWEVSQAVAMAKALGYVPEGRFPNARRLLTTEQFYDSLDAEASPTLRRLVDDVLVKSIAAAFKGLIDFNDQIYMPALFGTTFPRYPLVMVDEAQDLNPTNHALLDHLCRGRVIAVGDPWQSIYGFRGAVQDGMAKLQAKWAMGEKTISVSFRCPRAIVENVRWRVPHYKWVKDGGHVEHLEHLAIDDVPDSTAIICRNNAPLFKLALKLLAAGRSVHVAGSDIGPRIINLLKKLGHEDIDREGVFELIEHWEGTQLEKSKAPANIHDLAECMRVFASTGANLGQAVAYAEDVLRKEGALKLLTGHKAKGLEWDTVYHLDSHLIRDKDDEQEKNLRYVINTRAKDTLYEISSQGIE